MNGVEVRPAPTPEQQAAAAERLEPVLDVPVGYAHADGLLALVRRCAA